MAKTPDTVLVTVTIEEPILRPAVEFISSEFLEWLDSRGFELQRKAGVIPDERDFEELAQAYVKDRWP